MSIIKRIGIIVLSSALLFFTSLILPIKFCTKAYPSGGSEDFIVVRYDITKNWWILSGDANGLYDWNTQSDIPVEIKGINFEEKISADLYLHDKPAYFILWGDIELTDYYTITCTDWDVLEKINSKNKFRMTLNRDCLTIYDYKWFDNFRKLLWYYEDY